MQGKSMDDCLLCLSSHSANSFIHVSITFVMDVRNAEMFWILAMFVVLVD